MQGLSIPINPPLFSIITITLNCAEDAVRTARSVLSQDYPDFEYIVKDGGSTDTTVQDLIQLGVKTVFSGPDDGIYSAMNEALKYCSGQYACFINAGDLIARPTVLSEMADAVCAHKYPEFVYGDIITLDGQAIADGTHLDEIGRPVFYRDELSHFYVYRRMVCHQAWFVKRDLYSDMGGFDERFPVSSAYDFFLRVILKKKAKYVHVPIITAIYQGGGVSAKDTCEYRSEVEAIQARHFGRLERFGFGISFKAGYAVWNMLRRPIVKMLPSKYAGRFWGF